MAETNLTYESWYVDAHRRLLASLTYAYGDGDLAQEAADEAVVRAYERWDRVRVMASPTGWLHRVGFNLARRRLRRRQLEQTLLRGRARPEIGISDQPDTVLWHLVADLAPRQRQAVALRHLGQLREAEIAEVMGISRGTVSATLRQAYTKLRLELGDGQGSGQESERAEGATR